MNKYLLVIACLISLQAAGCNRAQSASSASPAPASAVLLSPTPTAAPSKTPARGVFDPKTGGYKPDAGFVPDEETAIAIAVAVWNPIYGKKTIAEEKPYKAVLKNGVWSVTGSLPEGYDVGGTAEAEIAQSDGRILKVIHSK